MHFKQLTIVSDTAIYEHEGKYFGFGPVVREIEFIEELFEHITWIGFERLDKLNDLSMQEIKSNKIKIVFLKRVGGKNIFSFLNILVQYPVMFFVILKNIYRADVVHTRAPSHPALIGVLISFFFQKKVWWNKYAGNWNQENPPLSYGFQRFIFKKAIFSRVTINGFWENQPKHCYSFENPCLTLQDIEDGEKIMNKKTFNAPFTFAFVGRLENPKGVDRILDALQEIQHDKIAKIHFIGDGETTDYYIKKAEFLKGKAQFHGFLGKNEVHTILAQSHFFLLPSTASEGFPKVIAEAACYGTIPIVSNVSSIPHYVNDSNGFLWNVNNEISFDETLKNAINYNDKILKNKSKEVIHLAKKFTFTNYHQKLNKFIFNNI